MQTTIMVSKNLLIIVTSIAFLLGCDFLTVDSVSCEGSESSSIFSHSDPDSDSGGCSEHFDIQPVDCEQAIVPIKPSDLDSALVGYECSQDADVHGIIWCAYANNHVISATIPPGYECWHSDSCTDDIGCNYIGKGMPSCDAELSECGYVPERSFTECTDGIDNDGDTFIDCEDASCQGRFFCSDVEPVIGSSETLSSSSSTTTSQTGFGILPFPDILPGEQPGLEGFLFQGECSGNCHKLLGGLDNEGPILLRFSDKESLTNFATTHISHYSFDKELMESVNAIDFQENEVVVYMDGVKWSGGYRLIYEAYVADVGSSPITNTSLYFRLEEPGDNCSVDSGSMTPLIMVRIPRTKDLEYGISREFKDCPEYVSPYEDYPTPDVEPYEVTETGKATLPRVHK